MALQKQAAAANRSAKSGTQDKDVQQIDGYSPLPSIQHSVSLPKFLEVEGIQQTCVKEFAAEDSSLECRKKKRSRFPKPGDTVEFEVIEQLDGLPTCKNYKTKQRRCFIAQLDGGDSSSEDDSDLEDDSSEVCV